MIELRPYQAELVELIRQAYAVGRRAPLVCLSTGGGKTTIFGYVTASGAAKGRTVFLLAHRAELVKQIAMTLARFGCRHQIVAPGAIVRQAQVAQFKALGRSCVQHGAAVYVCSAQTLVRRLDTLRAVPDLIVVDEAHHLTEQSTWGTIVRAYPTARLLPVTATPIRLDGRGLGAGAGGFADALLMGPTMRELIEAGHLSPYRIYAPPTALDLTGVRTRAGDYAKEQLATAVDRPTITGDAVAHYRRLAAGKRAVAFCVSVAHAEHVAAEFRAAGVPAESLDGSMDPAEREGLIARFEAGEVLVLASCDIVSEGFDLPAIEAAILLRPTQSLALYLQQVGRALRTFPGKAEAIVLDHVGAVVTHGLPDEERDWSLDGVKKGRRAANDNEPEVKITTCPKCFTIHRPAPACPTCGHAYPVKARQIEQADGELIELSADALEALRRQKRALQGKAQSKEALIAQGISPWRAEKILAAREAKAALVGQVLDGIDRLRAETGLGAYAALGVTLGEIRRMKPAELRALHDRIAGFDAGAQRVAVG